MKHSTMRLGGIFLGALLFSFPRPLVAQEFHFGIKGGVPLTDYFDTGIEPGYRQVGETSAATRRYTVGPAAEVWFLDRFGVEVDVLYKRMGYVRMERYGNIVPSIPCSGCPAVVPVSSIVHTKGNSWDVPIVAKIRTLGSLQPFLSGGMILRLIGSVPVHGEHTTRALQSGIQFTEPFTAFDEFSDSPYIGAIFGGGLHLKVGPLRFVPELRYAHWTKNRDIDPQFASDQVEFLLGVMF
jgi:hypothetical protein